jgi:hypothetical protein
MGTQFSQNQTWHPAMAARANLQMIVRRRDGELVEKEAAHVVVIMPASVDDDFMKLRTIPMVILETTYRPADHSRFDKLGPCTDDGKYLHV